MNWLARIKALLAHVTLVMEFCHDCGRRQRLVWTASDPLWARVTRGETTILCPDCFDKRAERMGLLLRWVPQVEREEARDG